MQNPETVSSVMRSKGEVLTIRWDATILEAAKLMREHGVGCLVAVYPDGRVAGILSERDIVRKVVAEASSPESTHVSAVMTAKVIALKPDATLTRARDIMAEYSIRHLPVIHRGKLEGMVSSRDLMAVELQSAQEIIKEQRGALQAAEKQYPGITKLTTMGGRVLI
jgi:CBS domain-containing protein